MWCVGEHPWYSDVHYSLHKTKLLLWTLLHKVKSTVKILLNFLAFLENINFKYAFMCGSNFYETDFTSKIGNFKVHKRSYIFVTESTWHNCEFVSEIKKNPKWDKIENSLQIWLSWVYKSRKRFHCISRKCLVKC